MARSQYDGEKDVTVKDFGYINVDGATRLQVKLVSYNDGDAKLDLSKWQELVDGRKLPVRSKRLEPIVIPELIVKLQEVNAFLNPVKNKKGK